MIDNILFKYMDRLQVEPDTKKEPGPVITISRECGCFAGEIAEKLVLRLTEENKKVKKEKWSWISKEILNDAATKLHSNAKQIEHFFKSESYKFLVDIMASFSKPYASDDLIKRTVTKVVKTYAEQGNVIIVGRAGFAITKDIPRSLHIKLIAPLNWRIKSVAKRYNLTEQEAKKRIEDTGNKRDSFVKLFYGKEHDDSVFHLVLNRDKLSVDEIVEQIMLLAKEKKLY
jgi:cytidylate kinase